MCPTEKTLNAAVLMTAGTDVNWSSHRKCVCTNGVFSCGGYEIEVYNAQRYPHHGQM